MSLRTMFAIDFDMARTSLLRMRPELLAGVLFALSLAGCDNGVTVPNYCGAAQDLICCTAGGTLPAGVTINSDGCATGLSCDTTSATCQPVETPTCGTEGAVCCSTGTACEGELLCTGGRCATESTTTTRTLNLTRTAGGSITFTSSTCPASYTTCRAEVPDGELIYIDATVEEGYQLSAWNGAPSTCDAASSRCAVSMTQDYDIQVVFEEIPDTTTTTRQLRLSRTGNGSVSTSDGACDVTTDDTCVHDYEDGTSVTLTASPEDGYQIQFWGVSGCDADASTCTFTMDRNRTIDVAFEAVAVTEHALNISRDANGTFSVVSRSCPNATCTATYTAGDTAVVIASPSAGYQVSAWTIMPSDATCDASNTRCEIPMDRERDLHIGFEAGSSTGTTRTLSVSRNDGGTFTVTGASCPGSTCDVTYSDGATATITATPDAGYTVERWDGATSCGTSTTCNVLMDADKTVSVVFAISSGSGPYRLEVDRSSGGSYSITGYSCWWTPCVKTIAAGESVTITATPDSGYEVGGWTGAPECGTDSVCTFTMSADRDVYLDFVTRSTYTLDVARSDGGTFQITGRSCPGSTCTQDYSAGATATIVATPSSGYQVAGWTGASECGTATTCALTMDMDRSVTVEFELIGTGTTHTLTVSRSTGGTFQIVGRSCPGSTCSQTYTDGETATITATPSSGYTVTRWEGVSGCGTSTSCDVLMNADQSINIVFGTGTASSTYSLVIVSATVPSVDGNGSNWDTTFGTLADLSVEASISALSLSGASTDIGEASGLTLVNESVLTGLTSSQISGNTIQIQAVDSESLSADELMCRTTISGATASGMLDGLSHTITCGTVAGESQTVSMPITIRFASE